MLFSIQKSERITPICYIVDQISHMHLYSIPTMIINESQDNISYLVDQRRMDNNIIYNILYTICCSLIDHTLSSHNILPYISGKLISVYCRYSYTIPINNVVLLCFVGCGVVWCCGVVLWCWCWCWCWCWFGLVMPDVY